MMSQVTAETATAAPSDAVGSRPLSSQFVRRDVSFPSEGLRCAGWLYVPARLRPGEQAPAIVMANAFSAIKEIYLSNFAERFAAAGFVTLVFDYRHYGDSEGEPRCQLFPQDQLDDLRNALTWLAGQPEVLGMKLGAWGISLGGGHVIHAAAFDRRIKAAVAMVPAINQLENFLLAMPREQLVGLLNTFNQDRAARYRSHEVNYMRLVAPPGQPAMMPPEAYDFYTHAQQTVAPGWENRITVESLEKFVEYNPAAAIGLVSPTPLLVIAAEQDSIIPISLVRSAFERASEPKELVVLPCLHSAVYNTEPYVSQAANAAVRWFKKALGDPLRTRVSLPYEQKRELMRGVSLDVWSRGDMDAADRLLDADLWDHNPFPGALPGREGFKNTVRLFRTAFPDMTVEPVHVLIEGNHAFDHWEARVTHTGEFLGVPPTGKKLTIKGLGIEYIGPDGTFTDRWAQFNALEVMQQLGVIPGGSEAPPAPVPVPDVPGGRTTSLDENKAIMRRQIEEIWNQGRLEVADEVFHPLAVAPDAPQLPPGPEGCKMVARMFRSAFPDFHMTIEDLIADGDMVSARFLQTGTHHGELFGIPPTGNRVAFEEIALIKIADGRIVASWFQTDMLGLMQQLTVGGALAP